jgi:hypothetical protein
MTLPNDISRCLGTADTECADCLRRITREQAHAWTWWMVPPVVRPCGQRVEKEAEHAD